MCEFCSDITFVFSEKEHIQLSKKLKIGDVIGAALNQLYDGKKIDKNTKKTLWKSYNDPLQKAVVEGYGKPLVKIEYGTPNYEFLKQLQTNTAVFAMFKSHASMKEMAALLKDADGNLRSKTDFIKESLKIDAKYRVNNLEAEYDTGVRQARMASQWQKFQKNKHLYPNLKYLLTKASKPDEKHLQFVGIIRPVDDAFWGTHYPPNRWRCQCSVEQTDDEASDIPDNLPPVAAEFAFNSGKTGQVFDFKNSDYIKKASPKEIPALIRDAEKFINEEIAAEIPYQPLYKSKNGNMVTVHPIAFDNGDFNENVKSARDLANSNLVKTIEIRPIINGKELRKKIVPDAKGDSNADFKIDGVLIDGKKPTNPTAGANTIQKKIRIAHDQADGILLELAKNYISKAALFEDIYAKMQYEAYTGFKIYLKYGNQWEYYDRESFLEEYFKRKKPQ